MFSEYVKMKVDLTVYVLLFSDMSNVAGQLRDQPASLGPHLGALWLCETGALVTPALQEEAFALLKVPLRLLGRRSEFWELMPLEF